MVIFIDIPKRGKEKEKEKKRVRDEKRMRQVNTRVTIVVELQVTEIHNMMVHKQVCGAIEV